MWDACPMIRSTITNNEASKVFLQIGFDLKQAPDRCNTIWAPKSSILTWILGDTGCKNNHWFQDAKKWLILMCRGFMHS